MKYQRVEKTQLPTVTDPLVGSNHITHSRKVCHKTCRRKDYYRYEMGLRRQKKEAPLRFGGVWHDLLDADAKAPEPLTPKAVAGFVDARYDDEVAQLTTFINDPDELAQKEWKLRCEAETVKVMFTCYREAWRKHPLEITSSEDDFDLPILNPETGRQTPLLRWTGKRDRLGSLNGLPVLVEAKTTSDDIGTDSDYRQHLELDSQLTDYLLSRRQAGQSNLTCVYDITRKPTIKPSTAIPQLDDDDLKIVVDENGVRVFNDRGGKPRQSADKSKGYTMLQRNERPDEWGPRLLVHVRQNMERYFVRVNVTRTEQELDEAAQEQWDIAHDLHDCRKLNRWYKNTGACRGFGRLCEYASICRGDTLLDHGVPEGFRLASHAHEELESDDESEES